MSATYLDEDEGSSTEATMSAVISSIEEPFQVEKA
jgi:hypothetical protein